MINIQKESLQRQIEVSRFWKTKQENEAMRKKYDIKQLAKLRNIRCEYCNKANVSWLSYTQHRDICKYKEQFQVYLVPPNPTANHNRSRGRRSNRNQNHNRNISKGSTTSKKRKPKSKPKKSKKRKSKSKPKKSKNNSRTKPVILHARDSGNDGYSYVFISTHLY